MKKILAVLLSAIMAVCFTTVAYASTATDSTADEVIKLAGIELKKLPDKLEYTLDDCDFYIGDEKITEDMFENLSFEDIELIFDSIVDNGRININVDFSGAWLIAHYNNYMTGSVVDNDDCSISVADPFKFSELKQYEDIDAEDLTEEEFIAILDEIANLIFREYTVDVTYEGFTTSYNIELVMENFDIPDTESNYEFVSYDNPSSRTYIISQDVYETVIYDDDYNEISVETVDVDTTGMTVILRDKETGELVTFDENNASFDIEFYHFTNDSVPLRAGNYYAIGTVYTDDGNTVNFTYKITFAESSELNTTPDTADKDAGKLSTSDSADKNTGESSTSDTPKSSSNENGAVQTGDVVPAMVLLALISGAVVSMYFYRRKNCSI